jgi:hypothetical protein
MIELTLILIAEVQLSRRFTEKQMDITKSVVLKQIATMSKSPDFV